MMMMMMLLLKKKVPLPLPLPFHLLQLSSLTKTSLPNPNFMTLYLINSCGFSPEKAARASKPLSKFTSPQKADSVIHFLKHHGGFADSQIRSIISGRPHILRADVNKTLNPNLLVLRKIGFSDDGDLRNIITRNPTALLNASAVSRLEYWKTFLGGSMEKLVCAFRRNLGLINYDVDVGIPAKIALLKGYGISETDIGTLVVRGCHFIRMSIVSMQALLKTSEELGFRPGSPMFLLSLSALGGRRAGMLKERMELLRSFGWTEKEFLDALLKAPIIVGLSEENIRKKMEFLVERAGSDQRYIASHPLILSYSLEKRLIPRCHIFKILKSNKLVDKDWDLYRVACLSEKNFVEKCILRYEKKVPKLLETYGDACAAGGGVQS